MATFSTKELWVMVMSCESPSDQDCTGTVRPRLAGEGIRDDANLELLRRSLQFALDNFDKIKQEVKFGD